MTSKEEQNHFLRLSQKAEEAVELMLSGFSPLYMDAGVSEWSLMESRGS